MHLFGRIVIRPYNVFLLSVFFCKGIFLHVIGSKNVLEGAYDSFILIHAFSFHRKRSPSLPEGGLQAVGLAAARSPRGSGTLSSIHYRSAASLRQSLPHLAVLCDDRRPLLALSVLLRNPPLPLKRLCVLPCGRKYTPFSTINIFV